MFIEEIIDLEELSFSGDYIIKKGTIPILITAPHTMKQIREDGSIKYAETFTIAIALYLNKHKNVSAMVKIKDTGIDSNKDNRDEFKLELLRFIKENNIKLVIDLHGSKCEREFDIEFGTLNNLSASFSTIKELEEAFNYNNVKNISHNDPFKGGAITQYVYSLNDVEVIQIEINGLFRDIYKPENLENICASLSMFIDQYKECILK